MINQELANALTEVSAIIEHLPEFSSQKIPDKFKKMVNTYKNNNYKFQINFTEPLENQNLLPNTRLLLSFIYTTYLKKNN